MATPIQIPSERIATLNAHALAYRQLQAQAVSVANRTSAAKSQTESYRALVANLVANFTMAPPSQVAGKSVFVDGVFNLANFRAIANTMGTEEGVNYLYGKKASDFGQDSNAGRPTLYKNVDHSGDEFSKALNPNAPFARGCTLGFCGGWQLGGPVKANEPGMYSSNMGQFLYIPKNPNKDVEGGIGVGTAITYEVGANTATTAPYLPWHYGGRGMNAINVSMYRDQGKNVMRAVAVARADGRPGWGISSTTITFGGLLMVDGQNTGSNRATAQAGAGLVPTAICQLNSNEFSFATFWDTNSGKAYLGVFAQAGTPQNCYLGSDPANWEQYRGELRGCFPGVPSYGNLSFVKLLGYVDLSDHMRCPTAVAASTFQYWGAYQQFQDNPIDNNGSGWDLRKALHRAQFASGGPRADAWAQRGIVTVISAEEGKAVFVDIKPMLDYYRSVYTSTNGVGVVGYNAGQFPPTFDEYAAQKPVIVKTLSLPGVRLSAVKMKRFDLQPRAYLAGDDGTTGKLYIVDMGADPAVHVSPLDTSKIRILNSVNVGRNPTCILNFIRHAGSAGQEGGGYANYFGNREFADADFDREVGVVSRGERKFYFVRFDANYTTGAIRRWFTDTRLVDPIWAEDNENHTTEGYVLTFADFDGEQLYNARYNVVTFWDHKGNMNDGGDNIGYDWDTGLPPGGFPVTPTTGPDGTVFSVECGGVLKTPGKVFQGGFANVY